MAKLEISLLVGAESKEFLKKFADLVERMEAAVATKATAPEYTTVEVEETEDEDVEVKPSKKKPKAKPAVVEEAEDEEDAVEETEAEEDDESEEEEEEAPKAKPKKKKLTIDDVNDACKARAKGGKRKEVLNILKKQFKVESVSELDEDQYADVIAAMVIDDE